MVTGSVLLLAGAYLLGALPFTVALAVASDVNPAKEHLHIALWHQATPLYAAVAVAVDIAKGAFPVLIGYGFSLPVGVVACAGVMAVGGQMWPPLRGHGEKGNSTGAAALTVLLLLYGAYPGLLSVVLFSIGALIRCIRLLNGADEHPEGYGVGSAAMSLFMLLGFVSAPLLLWPGGYSGGLIFGLVLLAVVIVIRRLTSGIAGDMAVGTKMGPVLLRRLFFDQSLVGRD